MGSESKQENGDDQKSMSANVLWVWFSSLHRLQYLKRSIG
jgi:hypothetical protein